MVLSSMVFLLIFGRFLFASVDRWEGEDNCIILEEAF